MKGSKNGVLPEFLKMNDEIDIKAKKEGFIQKNIEEYVSSSQWFFKSNKSAFVDIDEWAKVLFMIWFCVLVISSKSIQFMLFSFVFVILLAIISRAKLKDLLISSWGFIPIITFIIGLPYGILSKNMHLVVLQALKTGMAIMIGEVVIFNSRVDRLFKPFSFLGVPAEIISFIELTIKNIFVLLNIITQILYARKTRTIGKLGSKMPFVAQAIKIILLKSLYISEHIYIAMKMRGYNPKKKSKAYYCPKIGTKEVVLLFIIIMITIIERVLI